MAKFRYSLQNILNIKEKMETQAKQEFGTAQAALNVEIEHLERLKARRREYEAQSAGLLNGKLDLRAIEENKEALLKIGQYCGDADNPGGKGQRKCGGCQRTYGRSHEREKNA